MSSPVRAPVRARQDCQGQDTGDDEGRGPRDTLAGPGGEGGDQDR